MARDLPDYDADLFSEEALLDPYPHYRRMRELGPLVRLPRYNAIALPRFDAVKAASKQTDAFISGKGVFLNDEFNAALQGVTLCSDDARHDAQRKIIIAPLVPKALEALKASVQQEADAIVERLVARREFDAATELAHHLPVTIVSNLVGLPEEGRQRMLLWANATFNTSGPMNERLVKSIPLIQEMLEYIKVAGVPGKLKPGSWAESIWKAADRGEIAPEQAVSMVLDYVGPSLDTTISATTNTLLLLARNPEQWQMLRADPNLVGHVINESLRLESPIQFFTRYVARDVELEGVPLHAGERVVLYYASANRCETKWADPERFDILRKPTDHLAFGYGAHACGGMHLAKLEVASLLRALIPRVERFEIGEPVRAVNNNLRMIASLPVVVH